MDFAFHFVCSWVVGKEKDLGMHCAVLYVLLAIPLVGLIESTMFCYRITDANWKKLELERGFCDLDGRYSPQFIKSEVLSTPDNAFAVMVSVPTPRHLLVCKAVLLYCVH